MEREIGAKRLRQLSSGVFLEGGEELSEEGEHKVTVAGGEALVDAHKHI